MSGVFQILQSREDGLRSLCQHYDVRRLSLFGSAVSLEFDPSSSDFDFMVEFDKPDDGMRLATQFFGFLEELEEMFGRPIDLLEESAIENSRLRKSVLSTAVTIYAA